MISNRRRGQGMTEYIILVGLIGILLVAAVTRFKEQLRVTIEGSAGLLEESSIAVGDSVTGTGPGGGTGSYTKVGPGNKYEASPPVRGETYTRQPDGSFVRD
jgi:Flp pilus assembly pilin Flp